jgi:competence protein ComEC
LAGLVLGLGMALLLVESVPYVGEMLGNIIGGILDWMIWVMNSLIFLIQQLPMAVSEGFWLAGWELWLGYIVLIGLTYAFLSRQLRHFFLPLILLVIISSIELWESCQQHQQHKMIVYDVRKATCIDIVKGKSVITIASTDIQGTPTLEYAQQNNHWALGIEKQTILGLQKDTFFTSFLHYQYPVIATADKRLLILNKDLENKKSYVPIEVDYVLLCNNPKLESINQLDELCIYKKVIIDQSNPYWRVNKWKSQCLEEDIDFIDIGSQGAFNLDID